ncbi:hypothetical protein B0T09DRAFT_335895 [Sordaria sp. MPI-SDFR-AT-0083]|nr:hypothetical protein B0T09DRAFT_335895 [Sordaria sp. MPI-SDFR-AT-0083]
MVVFYQDLFFFSAKPGRAQKPQTRKTQEKKYGPQVWFRLAEGEKKNSIQQKGTKTEKPAARISWDTGHQNLSTPEGSTKRSCLAITSLGYPIFSAGSRLIQGSSPVGLSPATRLDTRSGGYDSARRRAHEWIPIFFLDHEPNPRSTTAAAACPVLDTQQRSMALFLSDEDEKDKKEGDSRRFPRARPTMETYMPRSWGVWQG